MFKKKDLLHDYFKKYGQAQIYPYLLQSELLNLALTSKKYYLLVSPLLTSLGLDQQKNNSKAIKKDKQKDNKKTNNNNKQNQGNENAKQVEITKVSINKNKQNLADGKWTRITQLPYYNEYLQNKLNSSAVFFYRNLQTNKILFINRSLVDPNLNYNQGGFNSDLEDQMKTNMYAEMFEGEFNDLDFVSPQALRARQKLMLEKIQKKKQEAAQMVINYDLQFVKGVTSKKIAIILCFGGSFSFGIFQDGKCTLHKSDKKYVCRKKAGERQLNKDKASGSNIQSMGSQIRRDQQKKHIANVGQILTENREAIQSCDLVFLQAPGLNRLFVINDNETLRGVKDRLRSVCLTAKKANYSQVESIYAQISKAHIVNVKQQVG